MILSFIHGSRSTEKYHRFVQKSDTNSSLSSENIQFSYCELLSPQILWTILEKSSYIQNTVICILIHIHIFGLFSFHCPYHPLPILCFHTFSVLLS